MIRQYNHTRLFCVACLLVILLSAVLSIGALAPCYANTVSGSNVLDDLSIDKSFDASLYPLVEKDNSLKVIQIAETTANELVVYVYQPSGAGGGIVASSINLAVQEDLKDMHNYSLKLVNSSGVFYKYLIADFKVSADKLRFYYVPSIYRRFINGVDDEADKIFDNTISEVVYAVNKQYRFATVDNVVVSEALGLDTIEVTDKIVGYVRYNDGFKFYTVGSCDSHFVAFNTDIPMDKILEADVEFYHQDVHTTTLTDTGKTTITRGQVVSDKKFLSCDQEVVYNGGGLFAKTFKFERIETIDEFIKGTEQLGTLSYGGSVISKDKLDELKKRAWVLRFYETKTSFGTGYNSYISDTTSVGGVSILRLKFVYEDEIYNLGVIDNKQSGSNLPINEPNQDMSFWDKLLKPLDDFLNWLEKVTGMARDSWVTIFFVFIAIVALIVLSAVFPPVWTVLKCVFRVLLFPFTLLKFLLEKIMNK